MLYKFVQIKEEEPNFWGEGSNSTENLSYLVPRSAFQF